MRKVLLGLVTAVCALEGTCNAADWGRFYHYPYSYFPHVYRRPFASRDFDTPHGYPMYPAYMAFPPYFRKDLYYPYLQHREIGGSKKSHHMGMHYTLDVF